MDRLRTWFLPTLAAEETGRRIRLLRIFLWLQIVATIPLAVISVVDSGAVLILALCLGMILLAGLGYWLARRKAYYLGVAFLILTQLAFVGFFTAFYGTRGPIPAFFVWPVMATAILMAPASAFLTATSAALLLGALSLLEWLQVGLPLFRSDLFLFWHQPPDPFKTSRFITDTVNMVINYYGAAFIIWVASRSMQQALQRSQEQARATERYQAQLEEKVAELNLAAERLRATMAVVREVGNPVLPIFEGIILTPLVGALDSERIRAVMDRVLLSIAQYRARVAILDITGVPVVDTAVANALVQTAQGSRLLGATPVLVGIRAEVAQTLVDLGVDMRGIVTRASLQEGLEYALQASGIEVNKKTPQVKRGLLGT